VRQLPDHVRSYRRTAEFTAETVPGALLKDHATKAGVWGLIHVLDGRLRYEISPTGEALELTPAAPRPIDCQDRCNRFCPVSTRPGSMNWSRPATGQTRTHHRL